MKTYFQTILLRIAGWLSENVLDKLDNPFNKHLIKSHDYRSLKAVFRPGTILLSRTKGEFTNLLIPGFFKHAAIVVNENEVTEAVGRGVVRTDLIDFMLNKDYIIALHPKFANPTAMAKAAKIATEQEGKEYDFDVIMSDFKSFYCSELVYFSYDSIIDGVPFIPTEILGRDTISPSDFLNAKGAFKVVWKSASLTKK